MADFNNPSDQGYYINHDYTVSRDQMHGTNPDYANSPPLNQTVNRGSNGIFLQPLNQVFSSSNPAPYVNNNIPTSENEPFSNSSYRYVENDENLVNNSTPPPNYNSSNTVHSPFIYQTLAQSPLASTYSNNFGMVPNTTTQGCVIIIMNANINLEKLLSVIQ